MNYNLADYQAGRRTEKKIAEDSNLSSSDPDVGAGRLRKRSRITKKLSKHIEKESDDDLRSTSPVIESDDEAVAKLPKLGKS